jgi:acyl carrier protein
MHSAVPQRRLKGGTEINTTDDLAERILKILHQLLQDENLPTEAIDADTHLLQQARVDSLLLISFLLAVEAELGTPIDFESLDFDDLSTVRSLAAVLANSPSPA